MKLRKSLLNKLNTKHTRLRLALALNVTEQSIKLYIYNNDDNLTKASALKVIREETGLKDHEILTEENITH